MHDNQCVRVPTDWYFFILVQRKNARITRYVKPLCNLLRYAHVSEREQFSKLFKVFNMGARKNVSTGGAIFGGSFVHEYSCVVQKQFALGSKPEKLKKKKNIKSCYKSCSHFYGRNFEKCRF